MIEQLGIPLLASIAIGARFLVATVLAIAALDKWRSPLEFQGVLTQYRLLPQSAAPVAKRLIPALELVAAAALLIVPPMGALLATTLLGGYAIAMGINIGRGRAHIDCGCGGEATPLSTALIIRNLFLVALLATVWFAQTTSGNTSSASSYLLGGLLAVGLGALYLCFNQLQVNAGIYRRLWLGERVG